MTNDTNDYDDFPASYSSELKELLLSVELFIENKTVRSIQKAVYDTLMEKVYQEIMIKVNNLTARTATYPHSGPVITMLLEKLMEFARQRSSKYRTAHIKKIFYQLELAEKLEKIDWDNHEIIDFTPVDEVLIYMNYNSKSYIKMLQGWLTKRIEVEANPVAQLEKKNFYQKAFLQLQRKPDVILYSDYTGLTEVMDNWFLHETEFLSNRFDLQVKVKETKLDLGMEKIKWMLSADQIALIIRAADASGLIAAKSMSAVFNLIVPHISSLQKEDLSPPGVRVSSYNAEQTDKDAAIGILQKMISRIKDF